MLCVNCTASSGRQLNPSALKIPERSSSSNQSISPSFEVSGVGVNNPHRCGGKRMPDDVEAVHSDSVLASTRRSEEDRPAPKRQDWLRWIQGHSSSKSGLRL